MVSNRIKVVSSAFIMLAVTHAHAALVADNFNTGYAPGASIANSTTPAAGEIWGRAGTSGVGYTLTATAPESLFTATANGQSATLRDSNTARGAGMGITTSFAGIADQTLRITFDYYVESAGSTSFGPTMTLKNFGAANTSPNGIFLQLFYYEPADGKYYIRNQRSTAATSTAIMQVALQTWYHVEITTQPANASSNDTYMISVTPYGGTAVTVSNLISRGNVSDYGQFSFIENNGDEPTGQFSIDNVQVDVVPEPSAMGLLSLGVLAATTRKR